MHRSPHEQERLLIHVSADVARARKAGGLELNHSEEAVAILTDRVLEAAREILAIGPDRPAVTELVRCMAPELGL